MWKTYISFVPFSVAGQQRGGRGDSYDTNVLATRQRQHCLPTLFPDCLAVGVVAVLLLLLFINISLQQVSREEGEETATTTTLLQRDSPDFVSLEEDTTERGERREGKLERENFRLKEQVPMLSTFDKMGKRCYGW